MNINQTVSGFFTPYDYERITVSTSAVGFTAAKLNPMGDDLQRNLRKARLILVTVETDTIRYTIHGVNPVATSLGHLGRVGDVLSFANWQAMKNFRAIREGGADGHLSVTYLR